MRDWSPTWDEAMTSRPNEYGIYPIVGGWEYTKEPGVYRACAVRKFQGVIWRSQETYDSIKTASERGRKFAGR